MSPAILRRIAMALVAVVLVWAAASVWRGSERDEPGSFRLPPLAPGQVERIALQRGADSIVAVRIEGAWRVNGFPGSTEYIEGFLAASADTTNRTELIARSQASHARLGVDSAGGRRMIVEGGGTVLADVVFGNRGPDFEGTYVRVSGDSAVFLLRGRLADLLLDGVDGWREDRILRVPAESIGRVRVEAGRSGWELARQGEGWVFQGGPADSAKVRRYLGQFGTLRASGFPGSEASAPDFSAPARSVSLFAADGAVLARLELVEGEAGAFWARLAGEGAVFRLPAATVESLAPSQPDLGG